MMPAITDVMLAVSGSLAASIVAKVTVTTALALVAVRLARKSRAAVRHVLLAAAFAVLLMLPVAAIVAPEVPVNMPIGQSGTVVGASNLVPSVEGSVDGLEAGPQSGAVPNRGEWTSMSLSALLLAIWAAGAIVCLVRVAAGMGQIHRVRRRGLPWRETRAVASQMARAAGVGRPVDVLLHEALSGPMTCGVVRPAIVLPTDARTWSEDDVRRAITHELEHVRRGDWLTLCLARAVCALYWFHPLVWISCRLLCLEAERACDDAVLRQSEAVGYADQLVTLAEQLSARSSGSLLAMANRGDLSTRVRAVLDTGQRRGPAGAPSVAAAIAMAAAVVAVMAPLKAVGVGQAQVQAQLAADTRKFDVASVKPCIEEPALGGQRRQEYTVAGGRANIVCLTLARIIFFAYAGIGNQNDPLLNVHPSNPDQIRGGPGWMRADKFTIEATAEGTPDRTVMMGPMLRALLEDRFQLTLHRETEDAPLYALTVAKGGLKMQPLGEGGCTSFNDAKDLSRDEILALDQGPKPICGNFTSLGNGASRSWYLGGESLSRFANQTLSSVLDRYVVDQTGVPGLFNIRLTFRPDESIRTGVFGGRPLNPPPPDAEVGPSIFTALEEQLGLKIEKTRGPRGFLVIDRVARPSEN